MYLHLTDSVKIQHQAVPDEERRRSLFSILLVTILTLCVPVSIYALSTIYFGNAVPVLDLGFQTGSPRDVAIAASSMSILAVIAFLLNRARKLPAPRLATSIFIIVMMAFVFLSDAPAQLISGRTSFMLLIPIFLASVLVFPAASVIVAILEMLAFLIIAPAGVKISNFSLVLLYFFSIISWASAHSGESAIAAALRESIKSETILESAADGLVVFSLDREIIHINVAAHRLLNEQSPLDLLDIVNQTSSQDDVWRVGWGSGRTLSVTKALMIENGQPVGMVLGIRDFTRETMIEQAKDAILGVVSHELRTPAAAIKGYVDILRSKGLPEDIKEEAIQIIGRNAQRLLFLVNDLLDRASIQMGTLKIINGRFSVASLAERVRDVVAGQLESKGGRVELNFDVDDQLPRMLFGDVSRLSQVLVNLVANGIKFTEKGVVAVRLFVPDENHWGMEVRDTGIGISPEVMEFIFEPIRRAPDYATRKYQGAGLGLSIAKELVTMMGGVIDVDSKVGEGSTFRAILPIIEEEQ